MVAIGAADVMHSLHTRPLLARLGLLTLAAALTVVSCSGQAQKDDPGSLPIAFGGSGGIVDSHPVAQAGSPSAGTAQGGDSAALPVCTHVPQGQVAALDDFEDGDSATLPEGDRQGFWGLVHDETTGIVTPSGNFVPELGGAHGTAHAAHVKASGYSNWGAAFEVILNYLSEGVHCPYNASAFKGVRFYAKGSGQTRVTLTTPEVQDKEYGGKCDPSKGMTCYDGHGTYLVLSAKWTLVELPWARFTQKGWGTPATFRPDAIMALQLSFEAGSLPVEMWVDEVSFWDGVVTPPSVDGEAGAGGMGNDDAAGAGGAAAP